ncbi:MAG: hypothetical protein H7141_04955 [Burkholderiales bacterium]|nr:hypothetical protein [Bacteroidia bacterium]
MKIRFKQFIAGFVFISMCGCSGAQPFKDAPIKYTPAMMNEIYKQVKTYPEHPYYSITFAHKGCAIEIWLNNMPQFISLDTMGIVTLPLNTEILNSGKQKLLIKIYLPFNSKELLKEENVSLEAKVEMNNERNDITTHKVIELKPKKVFNNKGKEVFDFEGKEIMEYTLEFNAAVPYKLKGWRNSKDLRKLPGIEQKVKAYYAHFRDKFAANDSVYFANVMYKKEFEMA